MSPEKRELGTYEFRIHPKARPEFIRKVEAALGSTPYLLSEEQEGADLILTVIPTVAPRGGQQIAQQMAELGSQVEVHEFKEGRAEVEIDF